MELNINIIVGLEHYLILASVLFTIGVVGLFLNRTNIINILMCIELMLLSININFVAFSAFINDISGQLFCLLILTVAAAETAIGLAIIVAHYRNKNTINISEINDLKG